MWRPAHGATSRPGPCRPASGYGRELERPGPRLSSLIHSEPASPALDPAVFAAFLDQEAEVPAPVTP
jgi:hypothetical protein